MALIFSNSSSQSLRRIKVTSAINKILPGRRAVEVQKDGKRSEEFDQLLKQLNIPHYFTYPNTPQTKFEF